MQENTNLSHRTFGAATLEILQDRMKVYKNKIKKIRYMVCEVRLMWVGH